MASAEVRTHSALHVLKGAAVSVLGPLKTTSAHAAGERGRLAVEFTRKPSSDELQSIEAAANRKVSENSEVLQFEMERDEAERHFGVGIYDAFPVPDVTLLTIVRIPEWEVNCCAEEHVDATGEIKGIKIDRIRLRHAKGLLEMEFHVVS